MNETPKLRIRRVESLVKESIKSLLHGFEREELLTFAMQRKKAVKLLHNSITCNRQTQKLNHINLNGWLFIYLVQDIDVNVFV